MKIQNLIRRSRGFQENALRIGSVEINMNARGRGYMVIDHRQDTATDPNLRALSSLAEAPARAIA